MSHSAAAPIIEQAIEHAGDHLKSALNSMVGEVASSGGDDLIETVRSQRDTLLTGTGKPRGDYLKLDKDRAQYELEFEALKERVHKYQQQVDRLGKLTQDYDQAEAKRPWEEAQRQLEGRKAELDRAERDLSAAEAQTPVIAGRLTEARTAYEQAEKQRKLAGLLQTRQRLEQDVRRLEQQKQALTQNLAKAKEYHQQLEQARQQAREIREARPDFLRQDIERYQNAVNQVRQAQENRGRELRDLKVRLEAWGAEGLEEQLNEKEAEYDQCNRRYQELHRRAQALDLLLNLLTEKRQALTRRLQAPLQKHLNHYLSVLFPEASLEVDEQLRPGTFSRGAELGQITELSFGAREQMGLISRLAYADLLREAGRPTLVILDDTLVHSNSDRLEDMKRILFDAASRHQILLFTCHPGNWNDLGVPPIDLQSLKVHAVAQA